ncbi:hypothetical protein [Verrucosispora sp. NA02020]|uniref:hypothetical protein n=1 Tax=Verrucosispora sp. NA02020 TaxID=2742132 RepID=UPI00159222AB|nr:hypothetical protein [Verrucosispora sp. NA02020]QKW15431.1 hypothetical protein HUT12_23465 [Verrucosispora sp. NA02020]
MSEPTVIDHGDCIEILAEGIRPMVLMRDRLETAYLARLDYPDRIALYRFLRYRHGFERNAITYAIAADLLVTANISI